jgi:hypothetical protein
MVVKVAFNKAAMDEMLKSPSGMVGRYIAERARRIVVAAKMQAGVKTGRLKNSIHMRHMRGGVAGQYIMVGSNLHYALLHHEGTKPHIIVPNRSTVLRFSSGGRVIYTRAVRHPGTRPNRYLTDNLYLIK